MAASTISRATWTDGSSGTTINNARLQADVYDKVDALIAANITFGGTISAEGFGTHTVSSGGSGGNILKLRNSTAGTTNYCQFQLDNDGGNIGALLVTSSTYTTVSDVVASAMALRSVGSGGLILSAVHASGSIKMYANSTVSQEAARVSVQSNMPTISVPGNVLGSRLILSDGSSSDSIAVMMSGEPGVSVTNAIFGNNYYGSTTASSVRRNTTIGGSFMRFGAATWELDSINASGTISTRLSMDSSGNFTMAGTLTAGDIAFRNGFAFTEHDKVGIALPGMALVNPDGDVVAFFDERGSAHFGHIWPDLDDLGWRRTTPEERAMA